MGFEETEDTSELTVGFLETGVEEIHARLGRVVTSLCPGKGRKGLSISWGVYPAKTTVDSLRDHRYHGKLFTRQQLEKLLMQEEEGVVAGMDQLLQLMAEQLRQQQEEHQQEKEYRQRKEQQEEEYRRQ